MADTTGFGPRLLPFVVFTVGAASLGAEIAAARLLAPYFGASTIVWANTIGVVLVALSVGYWLGGRFADRHPHLKGLCTLVLVSAGLLALVPFLARPFLGFSVEAFEELSAFTFLGSLFGVLSLVAVPVVLLGACAPYAVRLAVSDVRHSGEVAGRLYALSTAGSLLGTMSAALLLIPFAGTSAPSSPLRRRWRWSRLPVSAGGTPPPLWRCWGRRCCRWGP
jgi:predicted membrane-bound spermidine synthase